MFAVSVYSLVPSLHVAQKEPLKQVPCNKQNKPLNHLNISKQALKGHPWMSTNPSIKNVAVKDLNVSLSI